MKPSTRAALLSAFIFPGIGQMSLRFYRRGIALSAVAIAVIGVLVFSAIRATLEMLAAIESMGHDMDFALMYQEASRAAADFSTGTVVISFALLVACWVAAVVDAWLLGEELERTTENVRTSASDRHAKRDIS